MSNHNYQNGSDGITMDEFLSMSGRSKNHQSQNIKPSNETKTTEKVGGVRKPRIGNLNPFFNHKHSDETKAKMSMAQKARYDQMKEPLTNVKRIIREEIKKYLEENTNIMVHR